MLLLAKPFACIYQVAGGLDSLRARLLGFTMRSSFLKSIFTDRGKRLFFGILIAFLVQLAFAVRFPIPMLILGPMILGAPHLIASFRHALGTSPEKFFTKERLRVAYSALIWLAVILFRVFVFQKSHAWLELVGMVFLASLWAPQLMQSKNQFMVLIMTLLGLGVATFLHPFGTAAFLILLHHFIAFFHWIRSAPSGNERNRSYIALFLFSTIHVFIFAGLFDSWIGFTEWSSFPTELLEQTFFAWKLSPVGVTHCLVAYAFGQGVHYFLWLKTIPEQQHTAQVPTSFRQSLRLLVKDLRGSGSLIAFAVIAVLTTLVFAVSNYEFRFLYFAIASLHGFYEIFGLFLGEPA